MVCQVVKLRDAHQTMLRLASSEAFFRLDHVAPGYMVEQGMLRPCCRVVQVPLESCASSASCTSSASTKAPDWADGKRSPVLLHATACEKQHHQDVVQELPRGRLVIVPAGTRQAHGVISGETYVIPPCSAFFLGDAAHGLEHLGEQCKSAGHQYKMIVLDPPWPSKSRGKHYKSMSVDDLCKLPLNCLLARGGILAMWVTNDRKLVEAAQSRILEAWGLKYVATWYWLKVTCSGQLCAPLESPHKKPFERLILARHVLDCSPPHAHTTIPTDRSRGSMEHKGGATASTAPSPHHIDARGGAQRAGGAYTVERVGAQDQVADHKVDDDLIFKQVVLDSQVLDSQVLDSLVLDSQVLVSQPAQHSRKPFLHALLAPCVLPHAHMHAPPAACGGSQMHGGGSQMPHGQGLEMFAREMHAHWTSIGDQCLAFQHHLHLQPAHDLAQS